QAAKDRLSNFKDKPWRMYQPETVNYIMEATKPIVIVRAPCGAGKSLDAMVCGVMNGEVTYIVNSKFLQAQVIGDFPESVSILGRNNYQCSMEPSRSCDECLATESNPCERGCPYKIAKQKCVDASYRILNSAYWLAETRFAGKFSGSSLTILDEADAFSDVLVQNIALVFTERSLYQLGLESGPKFKTVTAKDGLSSWKDFGQAALYKSTELFKSLNKEIEDMDNSDPDAKLRKIREMKHFVSISEQCEVFLSSVDTEWRMEEIPRYGSRQGQLIFRPIWVTPELSRSFLLKHSERFVLLSATYPPLPVLCRQLGIDIDDVEGGQIYDVPTTFPPENAPVYVWPVASLSADRMEAETPKIVKAIKKILKRHPGQRGLIHCVSYKLGQEILKGVNSPRLIMHTSENRQEIINGFADSESTLHAKDAVLLSPSAERGIDLKGKLCDFIIIVKCPFKNLMDKVTQSRLHASGEIGKLWYISDAFCQIEQMSGRGVRSDKDTCSIYLIDQKIEDIYTSRPSLWSKNYRNQISWDSNQLLDD
ncbi:MAG TPA: helicase C-terminal domain-containing protein, partial [Candidatus Wunengus sp. YC60]|uniref:helicase C-terminal domain-containing protein n=1 Tax=Candidatus Wunengus sp. YC60 TaxID=3367697 RepID=UPI004029FAD0